MNNNRNNNRRRGRGNNNRGGQGGGNQSNRIDSRARGNAPQMLEKYRKLAHEAQLNDDRVQTEYYLQFADHYFRVIADGKVQKDEQQRSRPQHDGDDDYDDMGEDDLPQMQDRQPDRQSDRARPRRDDSRDNGRSEGRGDRDHRRSSVGEPAEGIEGDPVDLDEDDNPFTRDSRQPRPRKPQRQRREPAEAPVAAEEDNGFDPGVLPPAIARSAIDLGDDEGDGERPRRKLSRSRRSQPRDDDGEEALEAVS